MPTGVAFTGKTAVWIRATCAFLFLALSPAGALAASRAQVEAQFQNWLATDMWTAAQSAGITRDTYSKGLSGVTLNWKLPGLVPPGSGDSTPKQQRQAEFGSPGNYFAKNTIANLVAGGRSRMKTHDRLLAEIERRYGVPGRIVLAVWGRESGFGRVKIPHDAFRVLATKAFMSTRPDLFADELVAALRILQSREVPAVAMKSSWAGALGQPQFLPTSFIKHAVDFDGDGKRDIWNSTPDTLASIASYLAHFGWQAGRDWGFEVSVPRNVSCTLEGPDQGRPISQWVAMGVGRISGKPFPAHELNATGFLMMPAGRHGPAFIVTPNFYVLKEYNESDLYALFIGHVGDRIQWANRGFHGQWDRVDGLYRSDIAKMQRVLEAGGADVGGADGLPGYKTRRSIGKWQATNGRDSTCFPSSELVRAIR